MSAQTRTGIRLVQNNTPAVLCTKEGKRDTCLCRPVVVRPFMKAKTKGCFPGVLVSVPGALIDGPWELGAQDRIQETPAVWGPPSNAARHLACRSTYWDSALDGQPSPVYCMAVHTPFLVPNPDSSTPASSTQEQPFQQQDNHAETGQAMRKQGHAEFELTIYAPNTDLELRGWQGSTDAPEDLPDAVKSRSLCLLATLGGQFLGVTVKEERPSRNEERVVQVRVCTSSIFVALLWTST
eukprot:scaffold9638_cov20-Tisochrysis_lutea.AAC.1